MTRRFFALLSCLLLGLVVMSGSRAIAQDADSEIVLPLSPDPARCIIEPYSLAEMRTAWEEVSTSGRTMPDPIPDDVNGTPADEETIAAVTELLVNVIACAANGNDGLRDAAYLTEDHVLDSLIDMTAEDFDARFTETLEANPPGSWLMVYAVHDVTVLEDGRVFLRPDIIVPGVGHFIDALLLEEVDGRWLIDQSQEGDGNLYPATAMDGDVTGEMAATPES